MRDVEIEINIGDSETETETGDCGCTADSGTDCTTCGCCCAGEAPDACGCACSPDAACADCGCVCADPAASGGMNACAPKGKKRAPMTGAHNRPPDGEIRTVSFRLDQASGDGRTLEGYAAVFNTPTRIDSVFEGTFDEQIKPGAFKRYLATRTPTLMFEHGQHPLIGSMPLGVIERATEDNNGLFISARLSDNWLVQPVRDAVRDGAVTGMSFRFMVPRGGDTWQDRSGDVPLRTLTNVDVPELGPVVFPAYEPTTVSVRSALNNITGRLVAGSARGGDGVGQPRNGDAPNSKDSHSKRDHESLRLRGIL